MPHNARAWKGVRVLHDLQAQVVLAVCKEHRVRMRNIEVLAQNNALLPAVVQQPGSKVKTTE